MKKGDGLPFYQGNSEFAESGYIDQRRGGQQRQQKLQAKMIFFYQFVRQLAKLIFRLKKFVLVVVLRVYEVM